MHIIADADGNFRMLKSVTKNGNTESWKSDVKWREPGELLSYAANVLMTRQLVIDKFEGCVQSWRCDIDGEISLANHWFYAPKSLAVIDKPATVQQVDLILISAGGTSVKMTNFFLTETGNILKETSSEDSLVHHLNPFSSLPPKKCVKNLEDDWESDIQLMSKYLDFKAQRKDELVQQLENPRIKNLLRGYIVCLMKSKPQSVLNFTVDFMRKLERQDIARQTASRRRHQQI